MDELKILLQSPLRSTKSLFLPHLCQLFREQIFPDCQIDIDEEIEKQQTQILEVVEQIRKVIEVMGEDQDLKEQ